MTGHRCAQPPNMCSHILKPNQQLALSLRQENRRGECNKHTKICLQLGMDKYSKTLFFFIFFLFFLFFLFLSSEYLAFSFIYFDLG